MTSLIYFFAIIIGVLIGYSFGKIQMIAQQRYARRQQAENFKTGFSILSGSMQRTAIFLLVLALVQIGMPSLFVDNIQWIVSAGVVIGYGWILVQQLARH